MKYLETVIKSGIFSGVSKSDYILAFEELAITGRVLKKGSLVFHEGQEMSKLCIVKKGSVRGEKMYIEGDAHIIQLWDEDMIFGLEAAVSKRKTAAMDYISHEDSEIVFISWDSILNSRYSEVILEALLQKLADDNIKKTHKINILAHKGLREKIMIYLDILQKKQANPDGSVHVNMNREQLAQYLCVNRSALSNELSKMKSEGIIDFERNTFRMKCNKK